MIAEEDKRGPLKDKIEIIFNDLCDIEASLNGIVNCNSPGSKEVLFKTFFNCFRQLFNKTKYHENIPNHVINKCNQWFTSPRNSSNKNIKYTQKLSDEYCTILFDTSLIRYGGK